ncbi:hypothetical protein JS562_50060, partial [Agrobacterium sp. S2]|nr:hypothetical protein [Agrobacterium sp. S2]
DDDPDNRRRHHNYSSCQVAAAAIPPRPTPSKGFDRLSAPCLPCLNSTPAAPSSRGFFAPEKKNRQPTDAISINTAFIEI